MDEKSSRFSWEHAPSFTAFRLVYHVSVPVLGFGVDRRLSSQNSSGNTGEATCDPWLQIQARPKERVVCARCKGPSQKFSGCTVHGALQLVATFVKRPSQQSANQSAINPFQLTAHHYLQLFGLLLFNQPPRFCHQLLYQSWLWVKMI